MTNEAELKIIFAQDLLNTNEIEFKATFTQDIIMNNNTVSNELVPNNMLIVDSNGNGAITSYKSEDTQTILSNIRMWASDRNLIEGSTDKAQLCKLIEEIGELATAINKGLPKETVMDAIGDSLVVLTIIATQHNLSIRECLLHTWLNIKDRKGTMVNGIFIKENDQDLAKINK